MAEEHLKALDEALEQMRDHRRKLAANLAGAYARGTTEGWREQFVQIQEVIESIQRAIADEKDAAPKKYQTLDVGGPITGGFRG
ncbi:hypothetical protein [Phyllobacterium phragmitis]|nr:hypothetical protein [Phyllobacterium phragmitis]